MDTNNTSNTIEQDASIILKDVLLQAMSEVRKEIDEITSGCDNHKDINVRTLSVLIKNRMIILKDVITILTDLHPNSQKTIDTLAQITLESRRKLERTELTREQDRDVVFERLMMAIYNIPDGKSCFEEVKEEYDQLFSTVTNPYLKDSMEGSLGRALKWNDKHERTLDFFDYRYSKRRLKYFRKTQENLLKNKS